MSSGSAEAFTPILPAFRGGLEEAGYVEGRNVAIEFAWAPAERPRGMAIRVIEVTAMVHAKIKVTRNATDFSDTGTAMINPWGR